MHIAYILRAVLCESFILPSVLAPLNESWNRLFDILFKPPWFFIENLLRAIIRAV